MIPSLRDRIETVIGSEQSNEHLQSLLIEAMKGTALAADLAPSLETVMLSGKRFYREREAAAQALLPYRDQAWWRWAIDELRGQATDDSTRLAASLRLVRGRS